MNLFQNGQKIVVKKAKTSTYLPHSQSITAFHAIYTPKNQHPRPTLALPGPTLRR